MRMGMLLYLAGASAAAVASLMLPADPEMVEAFHYTVGIMFMIAGVVLLRIRISRA